LVDLAGSERLSSLGSGSDTVAGVRDPSRDSRDKETRFINGSLSALNNVLSHLAGGKAYVPFRSSPLTRLLQGSLREGKVCVITCVRREGKWRGETKGSLEFGGRARRVKVIEGKKDVKAGHKQADAGCYEDDSMDEKEEEEEGVRFAIRGGGK
jgi:kinesin family member 11